MSNSKHQHLVSHASIRLFAMDLDKSVAFYKSIGFEQYSSVAGWASYLRMGSIHIDLWKNEQGIKLTELQDETGHCYKNSALIISSPTLDTLNALHAEFVSAGVETNDRNIANDSHPFGENFTVDDPDGHQIVFRTLRGVSQ